LVTTKQCNRPLLIGTQGAPCRQQIFHIVLDAIDKKHVRAVTSPIGASLMSDKPFCFLNGSTH